jgi:Chaperone of endosialidase
MMKYLGLVIAALVLACVGHAQAQTGFGQIPAHNVIGNPTGSAAEPTAYPASEFCLSILGYGGHNNGTTANDSAWALAVSALGTQGGCIYFAPGKYLFSAAISATMPNSTYSIAIVGAGTEQTILYWPNASGGITINYTSPFANSAFLANFTCTTAQVGSGTCIKLASPGTYMNTALQAPSLIQNVTCRGADGWAVTDYWATCFAASAVSNVNFDKIMAQGPSSPAGTGLSLAGASGEGVNGAVAFNISNSFFLSQSVGIAYGAYVQGVTVVNSNFTTNTFGIYASATMGGNLDELLVTNSQFSPNTNGTGIGFARAVDNVELTNNLFLPNGSSSIGINAQYYGRMTINGNQFVAPLGGNCLVIGGNPEDSGSSVIIEGNSLYNCSTAIWLQAGSQSVNVGGNNIVASSVNAILNSGSDTTNIIAGNYVTGVTGYRAQAAAYGFQNLSGTNLLDYGVTTSSVLTLSANTAVTGTLTASGPFAVGLLQTNAWWTSGNPMSTFYAVTQNASTVLNDFELWVSGHNTGGNVDNTPFRSVAGVNTSPYNSSSAVTWLRAVEAQVLLGTGTAYSTGNEKIIEAGMHTQVAGNGTTAISGVQVFCSHTGWLSSGTRCDSALYLFGEDGWNYGLYYLDTDAATVLASIDQHGNAYFKGSTTSATAIFGSVYGGTAANSILIMESTSNGSPSGDYVAIRGSAFYFQSSPNGSSLFFDCNGTTGGVCTFGEPVVIAGASGKTALVVNGVSGAALQIDYTGAGTNYYDAGKHIIRTSSGAATVLDYNNATASTWTFGAAVAISGSNTLNIGGLVLLPNLSTDTAATTTRTVCQNVTGTGTANALYFGSGTAGICKGTSGRFMKQDIAPIDYGLAEVMRTEVDTFQWRPGYGHDGDLGRQQVGFMADNIASTMPRFATIDDQGRATSVDYMGAMMVLFRAVQQIVQTCDEVAAANDNFCIELKRRTSR